MILRRPFFIKLVESERVSVGVAYVIIISGKE